ncbi:FAD-dependent oxidoreductase [Microlunatus sp. Y2014]|uniref:FAD-dependent oxidoreductase n=1 Tax=Microlunatus sp. Y2014 TaxID=3418488 RepID=UPI003DA791B1
MTTRELRTPILVVGGGLGGVAAALAAAENGQRVVLTEQYRWLGGQSTSQAVPFDEHPWIERFGGTRRYRRLRSGVRDYYRAHFPLTERSRNTPNLNPGAGVVSKLCHDPRVAVAVIDQLLLPHLVSGRITVLQPVVPVAADVDGDVVRAVTLRDEAGELITVAADYVIDATDTGELLPLTGTEYVTGFEARAEHDEPSAPDTAQPMNMQAVSICFALEHVDGDHTIERPAGYDRWRDKQVDFWGDRQLSWTSPDPRTLEPVLRTFNPNPGDDVHTLETDQSLGPGDTELWLFRRIAARDHFEPGFLASDITMVNWAMIDYFDAPVIDVDDAPQRLAEAKELSASALYWMQTEAPRADGGTGWPGLRLRPDVMGTDDGFAMAPYYRESRRIKAVRTVTENDVSLTVRAGGRAADFHDSVGIGMYRIDLHPSTGGDNYIDVPASPFQIPLGALLPQRVRNLLPACKNIGTTHITNGCYRLHPVEWNIGEVAGLLAATSLAEGTTPHQVRGDADRLARFQDFLTGQGIELAWPDEVAGY